MEVKLVNLLKIYYKYELRPFGFMKLEIEQGNGLLL